MERRKSPESQKNISDMVWDQLRELPAFRALIRTMEVRMFSEWGPLPRPMLDIGCGDGHFGQSVWDRIEAGIDRDMSRLCEAKKRNVYDALFCADANFLPFPDASFATVVSNSVIEHIPDIRRTISEIYRVLREGGQFIFSVPTDRLNDGLGITRMLIRIGAARLAERYKAWFKNLQVHFHLYSPKEWQTYIEAVGFRLVWQTGYMSPRATALFDLCHFYGFPNLILHKMTGRWVIWPWRPRFALREGLISSLVAEKNPGSTTCHFFIAIKESKK
jgi:ubiquinone/menaquinone biosynthesis C-methylase UbiE